MSDTPELTALTIKDLRQLAGEHHIQNASRMGKERLLGLLQGVLAARAADGLAAAPAQPQLAEVAAAAASVSSTITSAPVTSVPAPSATALDADEPETLDAAAVSALTDDVPSVSAAAANSDDAPGENVPGEGEPRRRRRRRRRRGGRGDGQGGEHAVDGQPGDGQPGDGQPGDDDGDEDGPEQGAAPTAQAAAADATASPTGTPAATAPEGEPARDDRPRNEPSSQAARGDRPAGRLDRRPERGPDDRPAQRAPDARPAQSERAQQDRPQLDRQQQDRQQEDRGPGDNRPARPRLNGPQRPVSSVLDRLSVFTRGVLELCDPSTPSWAQPRLAELLSEAGVVPMPSQGAPHPEYHRVLGTLATTTAPAGHICEITAPGFALRGDRGDLFCLRKADVRLAGARTEEATPGSARAPRPEPRSELTATAEPQPTDAVSAAVAGAELQPRTERSGDESARGERSRGERGRGRGQQRDAQPEGGFRPRGAERRPEGGEWVADAPPAESSTPELLTVAPDAPTSTGDAVERGTDDVADSSVSESSHVSAESADAQPIRPPLPSPGRSPERTHPRESATTAQPLPLTHLATDELAAKPKAEAFRALGLNDQILADLAAMGWKEPAPIQAAAIPVALAGKDLIGQAQTGTGKTAGFVLPTLQKLYALDGEGPVALMLCPTRELAKQVHAEFVRMAGTSAARCALIYGGVPMEDQFRALQRKPHVIIGTPGRVIDHMKRKTLDLSRLSTIVLDEADQMLDIGFWPDVTYIMSHTPPSRQVLLFSATFPEQVKELAEKHMREPVRIQIEPEQVTVGNVDQKYIAVPRERKNELLAHFIETFNPPQMVVFCKTKHQTDRVAEVLKRKHMSAGAIHGDLPQSKREKTLQAFRAGELQCLVATNVAARGLDIPSVSHVVNFDVPETPEEYVHRIGRTARNGASGVARTFITSEDGQFLLEIEKHIGLLLEEEQVEGFTLAPVVAPTRTIADQAVGTPRLLKPLIGGIRLGRRR